MRITTAIKNVLDKASSEVLTKLQSGVEVMGVVVRWQERNEVVAGYKVLLNDGSELTSNVALGTPRLLSISLPFYIDIPGTNANNTGRPRRARIAFCVSDTSRVDPSRQSFQAFVNHVAGVEVVWSATDLVVGTWAREREGRVVGVVREVSGDMLADVVLSFFPKRLHIIWSRRPIDAVVYSLDVVRAAFSRRPAGPFVRPN